MEDVMFKDGEMSFSELADRMSDVNDDEARKYIANLDRDELFDFICFVEDNEWGEATLKCLFEISLALAHALKPDKA